MGLIFAVPGHIEKIKSGEKTQTRRLWDVRMDMRHDDMMRRRVTVNGRLKWRVGKRYAVLPGRGKKGVGWIVITSMWLETMYRHEKNFDRKFISVSDALAEGGYTPEEYEALWDKMYPNTDRRLVIEFEWVGEKG